MIHYKYISVRYVSDSTPITVNGVISKHRNGIVPTVATDVSSSCKPRFSDAKWKEESVQDTQGWFWSYQLTVVCWHGKLAET